MSTTVTVADLTRDLEVAGVDVRTMPTEQADSFPHVCLTWFLSDGTYLAEVNPSSTAEMVANCLEQVYSTVAMENQCDVPWAITPDPDEPTAHVCWTTAT